MPADRPHDDPGATLAAQVGLCARCCHAIVQRNARGSAFWRCGAADEREDLRRYPPLPVRGCPSYEAGSPARREPEARGE